MQVRSWLGGVVFGAIIAGGIGIAYASVPDSKGVIHGCYNPTNNYTLRVLDTAKTATCPTGQTALNWNQNGAIIVARPRLSTPTLVPFGASKAVPLTSATWSQAATSIQTFFFHATVKYPASCTVNTSDEGVSFEVDIDGVGFTGGNMRYVQGGTASQAFGAGASAFLFEPGTAKTHTMTVTANPDGCSGSSDTPTVTEFSADVVGTR
jgi:hypothetical protein